MKSDKLNQYKSKYFEGTSSIEEEKFLLEEAKDSYFDHLSETKKEEMNWDFDDFLAKVEETEKAEQTPIVPLQQAPKQNRNWVWMAAAVAMIGGLTFVLTNKNANTPTQPTIAKTKTEVVEPKQDVVVPVKPEEKDAVNTTTIGDGHFASLNTPKHTTTYNNQVSKGNSDSSDYMISPNDSNKKPLIIDTNWKGDLTDSQSSSVRLAAILTADKADNLNSSDLQLLAHVMNTDENSNVRLAALEVLDKRDAREDSKKLILDSVEKQNDPIVQMQLFTKLSPDEASTVKNELIAIAQNPRNIEAVRDQAYAALLRSKIIF